MQHALQGWCPPLPVLRRLGFRTQNEIERERYALEGVDGATSGTSPTPPSGRIRCVLRRRLLPRSVTEGLHRPRTVDHQRSPSVRRRTRVLGPRPKLSSHAYERTLNTRRRRRNVPPSVPRSLSAVITPPGVVRNCGAAMHPLGHLPGGAGNATGGPHPRQRGTGPIELGTSRFSAAPVKLSAGPKRGVKSSWQMADASPTPPDGPEPLAGLIERVTFHSVETGFAVLQVKVRGHAGPGDGGRYAAGSEGGGVGRGPGPVGHRPGDYGRQFRGRRPPHRPARHRRGDARSTSPVASSRASGRRWPGRLVDAFDVGGLRRDRAGPREVARTVDRHRQGPAEEDRLGLERAEGGPRDHGLPARRTASAPAGPSASTRPTASSAIDDGAGKPVPPRPRHPGHRLQDRRPARRRSSGSAGTRDCGPGRACSYVLQRAHRTRATVALPRAELVEKSRGRCSEIDAEVIEAAIEHGAGREAAGRGRDWTSGRAAGSTCAALPVAEIGVGRSNLWPCSRGHPPAARRSTSRQAVAWVEERDRLAAGAGAARGGRPGAGAARSWSSPAARASARRPWSTRHPARSSRPRSCAVVLCAPTGRAAKRLSEATGPRGQDDPPPAGVRPGPGRLQARAASNPLEGDLFVVDETSHGGPRCSANQLAPGRAAARLPRPGRRRGPAALGRARHRAAATSSTRACSPSCRLTEIFRQAAPEPDRHERPPRQPRAMPQSRQRAGASRPTSTSSRPDEPGGRSTDAVVRLVRERIPEPLRPRPAATTSRC